MDNILETPVLNPEVTQGEQHQPEPHSEQSQITAPDDKATYSLADVESAMRSEAASRRNQRETEARERAESDEAEESATDSEENPEEETEQKAKSLEKFAKEEVEEICDRLKIPRSQLKNKAVVALIEHTLEMEARAAEEESESAEGKEGEEGEENAEQRERREAEDNQRVEAERQQREAQSRQPYQPTQEEFTRHIQTIHAQVQDPTINSPEMVEAFKAELRQCFGADPSNPEAMQNVDRLTNAVMIGGHNLINTLVPRIMGQYAEQMVNHALPGLKDMYIDSVLHNSWEEIRTSDQYKAANFPKYGTAEFDKMADDLFAANPWFRTARFSNNFAENVRARAELAARLMNGERFDPKTVADAFAKGKAEATKAQRRVSAGRALGSGRGTGRIASGSDKPAGGGLMDAWSSRHGSGF